MISLISQIAYPAWIFVTFKAKEMVALGLVWPSFPHDLLMKAQSTFLLYQSQAPLLSF